MLPARALSKLLLTLYAAPASPDLWPKALRECADFLHLPAAAIVQQDTLNNRGGLVVAVGLDPLSMRNYEEYYSRHDAYRISWTRKPRESLLFGDDLCPPQELQRTEFYNDFLLKQNVVFHCGMIGANSSPYFENLSFYRRLDRDVPNGATQDRIELIIPHIRSALLTRRKLLEAQMQSAELTTVLATVPAAILLLDEKGACIFLNAAAENLLAERDGLCVKHSRLLAAIPSESARLEALIRQAISLSAAPAPCINEPPRPGAAMLISRRNRGPLQVFISPFLPAKYGLPRRAVAMVSISDPEQCTKVPAEILRALYGLTPAESRVASAIAEGKDLHEISALLAITYATARAHLRSIFDKTGASRQAELVALVLRVGIASCDAANRPR